MMNAIEIAQWAKEQLAQLTGLEPDTVSKLDRDEHGWQVTVEMVEMKYVPSSGDMLGSYKISLDDEGNLLTYQRTRRYRRNQAIDEDV
jgi:hypothetical protein